jgi:hypothetical protein
MLILRYKVESCDRFWCTILDCLRLLYCLQKRKNGNSWLIWSIVGLCKPFQEPFLHYKRSSLGHRCGPIITMLLHNAYAWWPQVLLLILLKAPGLRPTHAERVLCNWHVRHEVGYALEHLNPPFPVLVKNVNNIMISFSLYMVSQTKGSTPQIWPSSLVVAGTQVNIVHEHEARHAVDVCTHFLRSASWTRSSGKGWLVASMKFILGRPILP